MSIKRMNIKEFHELGFLQEANRQFFHPLGLALEVSIDDDGNYILGGVWDYRDDPEGMTMGMEGLLEHDGVQKAQNVRAEYLKHVRARQKMFNGRAIQPIPGLDADMKEA
jgi:hypothetical protein